MSNKTEKIVTMFLWGLIIVSAILILLLIASISGSGQNPNMDNWIGSNLIWAYVLIIVGAGIALSFGLIQALTDLRASKKALIAVGVFVVIIMISYLLASDTIPQFLGSERFINDGTLTARVAKLIDMGLYTTYTFIVIAVLSVLSSSLTRFLK